MKAKMIVQNPGSVEMTLQMTAPLDHWKKISAQLGSAWPGSDLAYLIDATIRRVDAAFAADTKEQGERS